MKKRNFLYRMGLIISIIAAIPFFTIRAYGQVTEIDYNTYYRYPLSIGMEYQNLTPFADYGSNYNIFDLSARIRWPFLKSSVFIPTASLGIMRFDSQDPVEPEKWDHRDYYLTLGILYTNRFSKNFELGAEASAGYAMAVFPNLVDEKARTDNLLLEIGARVALNPSYNFSIDVNPNLKYMYAFNPLKDFNGLIFGIGFSAHYRFGQDPDAPTAVIRSIKFVDASIPPVFAAMQSYYPKNPLGSVTITNTDNNTISDIEVSFFQAGYMDSPTPSASIEELGAGESRKVDLYASFNQEVFRTEGITPLTGEIIATYTSRGKPAEQKQSVSFDLHDKTAITWDDDRKVAAFITPADSALRNYASFIRQSTKDEVVSAYSDPVQFGIQVYYALTEIGCMYQVDPTSPFTSVQEDPMVVDSISLPRDTLNRITGDCDDLTVLYNSLLETVGIETGFITVPGHIYSVFNTKVGSRDYQKVHPDRRMTINVDGQLWVPVEITMIGTSDFNNAWRKGIEEWIRYEDEPDRRGFYQTYIAQELYRPVGLRETDLGLQYGNPDNIVAGFKKDMGEIVEAIVADYRDAATKSGNKEDWNKLGIVYAKFNQYGRAESAFNRAISIDPAYTSAQINLGNVAYLRGNYRNALHQFTSTYETLRREGKGKSSIALKVLLNISKTNYELEQYDDSKSYYDMAQSIDPKETERYSYLGSVSTDETRAASMVDTKTDILFIEDEK